MPPSCPMGKDDHFTGRAHVMRRVILNHDATPEDNHWDRSWTTLLVPFSNYLASDADSNDAPLQFAPSKSGRKTVSLLSSQRQGDLTFLESRSTP